MQYVVQGVNTTSLSSSLSLAYHPSTPNTSHKWIKYGCHANQHSQKGEVRGRGRKNIEKARHNVLRFSVLCLKREKGQMFSPAKSSCTQMVGICVRVSGPALWAGHRESGPPYPYLHAPLNKIFKYWASRDAHQQKDESISEKAFRASATAPLCLLTSRPCIWCCMYKRSMARRTFSGRTASDAWARYSQTERRCFAR